MAQFKDGPRSPLFFTVPFAGNTAPSELVHAELSDSMKAALTHAPSGECVCRGMPFQVDRFIVIRDEPVEVSVRPFSAPWVVFMHTADVIPVTFTEHGFPDHSRGYGRLNEHAATYTIRYADGSSVEVPVRRRHEIGAFQWPWGENCFQAVAHRKPFPIRPPHEQLRANWGHSQTRAASGDGGHWLNWLWAWENPDPGKEITGFSFAPVSGTTLISGISAGNVHSRPVRWERRRKAVVDLRLLTASGGKFSPDLDEHGLLSQVQLDLGQVISAEFRKLYPNEKWESTYNNMAPELSDTELVIEYTAHEDARLHIWDGSTVPVSELQAPSRQGAAPDPVVRHVKRADTTVTIRVVEKGSGRTVPVKLHVHGESGEYLAPNDRHRIPNPAWFEDYSTDFVHYPAGDVKGRNGLPLAPHVCTYIPGETHIDLPLGRVYVEVSKGYEIRPVRKVVEVTSKTEKVTVEVERVLPWRERGWVTADTHVHFLSPQTALLEGSAEGVNVINLLASQWGELMTNVGDFDGRTTWGSKEAGGEGEYLVRVGTENRQHVLGHISLLGYDGGIISPMTTGGPDESALGDPVGALLTEWAMQCREQNGVVVIPHFPNPRAENAATIVKGEADGVEMTSWGNLYAGINPYSLWDWYRYLNCGYPVAAVGGTDKMSATTAVGTVRTYAMLDKNSDFSYAAWKSAIRSMRTFVTYGPLLEFSVEGRTMGDKLSMSAKGGTVDVHWQVASVTVPVSSVELVVNGEVREKKQISVGDGLAGSSGSWNVKIDRSSWLALLIRGHYEDRPEIIAAHSSAVFIHVEGSEFSSELDAVSILEQIEGALAFIDIVGTKAETADYRRMRLVLESAHRDIHNRMHKAGYYHEHTAATDHADHH